MIACYSFVFLFFIFLGLKKGVNFVDTFLCCGHFFLKMGVLEGSWTTQKLKNGQKKWPNGHFQKIFGHEKSPILKAFRAFWPKTHFFL